MRALIEQLRNQYKLAESAIVVALFQGTGTTYKSNVRNRETGEYDDIPSEALVEDFGKLQFPTEHPQSVRFGNEAIYNDTRDAINEILAPKGAILEARTEMGNAQRLRQYSDGSVRCKVASILKPITEGKGLEAILQTLVQPTE